MKKINLKSSLAIILLFGAAIIGVRPVLAAEMFFGSQALQFDQGNIVEIGVLVNSQNESINALEGQIAYPTDYLTLKSVEIGNSVINLWLQSPVDNNGTIDYSGIIPGGYRGDQGYLFSLIFVARKAGKATLSSQLEKILLNDGQGTAAKVTRAPLILKISNQLNPQKYIAPVDQQPPEVFTPLLSRDSNLFGGQYFLAFTTQDKSSGIKGYVIAEQRGKPIGDYSQLAWSPATSPYQLKDQGLHNNIYIKAIDQAGNERVAVFLAPRPLAWYQNLWLWIGLAALILIVVIIIYSFLKQRKDGGEKLETIK
jgi:hypothetical protein